jgi:hypothetical protein
MRKTLTFIAVVLAVLALAAGVAAQSPPRGPAPPTIVIVNARPTASLDGATMFEAYCASCHGTAGRGNGPAARVLSVPVPDLTQYSEVHDVSQTNCLRSVLAQLQAGHRRPNEPKVSAGDLDMPSWEPIFRSMSSDPGLAYVRLRNISAYVVTIQAR